MIRCFLPSSLSDVHAPILASLMAYCLSWRDVAVLCTQVWIQRAHKLLQLPCLVPMPENALVIKMAYTAVLDRFRTAPYSIPAQTGKVFASE